jgi:hypothetical protein
MTSSKTNKKPRSDIEAYMKRVAKAKLAHRVELANLPFEEKIRIMVELQKIDNKLAKAAGRKTGKVWKI